MKSSALIIVCGVTALIVCALIYFKQSYDHQSQAMSTVNEAGSSQQAMLASTQLEPLLPLPPIIDIANDGKLPGSDLQGVTADPYVVRFFKNHSPEKDEVGTVRAVSDRIQQLYIGERLVFEAAHILKRRSISSDGTVALAAIIGDAKSGTKSDTLSPDDNALMDKGPSAIWIVDSLAQKKRISPPSVTATLPLIAPDGHAIAFTGQKVSSVDSESSCMLFVVDSKTGQCRTFGSREHLDNYIVSAAEWSDDGKLLYVLEDHGETGGHMVMKCVRFK